MLRAIVIAAVIFAGLSVTPAGADHDMVFAPCDPEDTRLVDEQVWFIDYQSGDMLRFDDPWWGERPGFGRYTNWRHQCRLGMTGVWAGSADPAAATPTDPHGREPGRDQGDNDHDSNGPQYHPTATNDH